MLQQLCAGLCVATIVFFADLYFLIKYSTWQSKKHKIRRNFVTSFVIVGSAVFAFLGVVNLDVRLCWSIVTCIFKFLGAVLCMLVRVINFFISSVFRSFTSLLFPSCNLSCYSWLGNMLSYIRVLWRFQWSSIAHNCERCQHFSCALEVIM